MSKPFFFIMSWCLVLGHEEEYAVDVLTELVLCTTALLARSLLGYLILPKYCRCLKLCRCPMKMLLHLQLLPGTQSPGRSQLYLLNSTLREHNRHCNIRS
ncbi:hypothetical protein HD806DRAFT_95056 [Xylariaceae sp. AK1471]|nr:hypothetical protein HD806DRAFT_95056 [Xylariaceae sp. AK1471]